MILRWCESPGNAARIAALSADHAPTAIIGCPHMTRPWLAISASHLIENRLDVAAVGLQRQHQRGDPGSLQA
jgi:hypothetical protein